mgnify:CR=1 FL=1
MTKASFQILKTNKSNEHIYFQLDVDWIWLDTSGLSKVKITPLWIVSIKATDSSGLIEFGKMSITSMKEKSPHAWPLKTN